MNSNDPAPVPASSCSLKPRHASFHQIQRWFELASVSRDGLFEISLDAGAVNWSHHVRACSPADGGDGLRRRDPRQRDRDGGADDERRAEEQALVHPCRVGRAVARHAREREREADHACRRHAGRDESGEPLQPEAGDDEPRPDNDHRHRDAAARVRQRKRDHPAVHEQRAGGTPPRREPEPERQCDVAEQREGVPVADWAAQASDAPVVLVEPGEDLAGERPGADGAEQRAEADRELAGAPGDERAEDRERGVDDGAVRVVPAAVGLDRPGDRRRAPERKRDERQEHDGAARESAGRGKGGGEEDRRAADPRERRVARGAAEEKGCGAEHERGTEWRPQFPSRPHLGRR